MICAEEMLCDHMTTVCALWTPYLEVARCLLLCDRLHKAFLNVEAGNLVQQRVQQLEVFIHLLRRGLGQGGRGEEQCCVHGAHGCRDGVRSQGFYGSCVNELLLDAPLFDLALQG